VSLKVKGHSGKFIPRDAQACFLEGIERDSKYRDSIAKQLGKMTWYCDVCTSKATDGLLCCDDDQIANPLSHHYSAVNRYTQSSTHLVQALPRISLVHRLAALPPYRVLVVGIVHPCRLYQLQLRDTPRNLCLYVTVPARARTPCGPSFQGSVFCCQLCILFVGA
jgi:hypothetical protein